MAILNCKMCGGKLVPTPDSSVVECEYCGTVQTIPLVDNEKKLTLFARANRLRMVSEFDKAAGIYETIVTDFPEEAEAYWGLVLCKFGIEYVDDPATGRKIPTCHRSSFDSVMDDDNFEQAVENADIVARKIYRTEAKQIEEIRKNIIDVSSKEEPYDIFICYKENDEDGNRTLDSVLAQDIYDILMDKGYKVFFSRITLEDKLGQEYEPYIFSALNSAKIMLAVGTDYEYYNAVWVKNEWKRYLMLMTQDKTKYLIPCYKNIDAYDMPKEFNKLQAQDMGKVGAMQDLLRGIEKILPREKEQPAKEQIYVSSGDNKIASLLERGNMALEDGDWNKADSFFERVLDLDAKNAKAYIGKTLIKEECRTLDEFVCKYANTIEHTAEETYCIKPDEEHIALMIEQYAIGGYLGKNEIRKMYEFDMDYVYLSKASSLKAQINRRDSLWADHKWLGRAEKFASDAEQEILKQAEEKLREELNVRLRDEQKEDKKYIDQVEQAYREHLSKTDESLKVIYDERCECKNKDYRAYQQLVQKVKSERDRKLLQKLEQMIRDMDTSEEGGLMADLFRERLWEVEKSMTEFQSLVEEAQNTKDCERLWELIGIFREMGPYEENESMAELCRKRLSEEEESTKSGERLMIMGSVVILVLIVFLCLG